MFCICKPKVVDKILRLKSTNWKDFGYAYNKAAKVLFASQITIFVYMGDKKWSLSDTSKLLIFTPVNTDKNINVTA